LNKKIEELERLGRTKDQENNLIRAEAKEVRDELDAIQNIKKVSVEIQTKPEMKDA